MPVRRDAGHPRLRHKLTWRRHLQLSEVSQTGGDELNDDQARRAGLLAIPVALLATAQERPTRCARHGQSAVRRIDFMLQSRPRPPRDRFPTINALQVAGRLGEHASTARLARVTNWPLCARCVRTRRVWLTASRTLLAGGLVALGTALTLRIFVGRPSPALGIPLYGGLAMLLASPFAFVAASIPRLTRARTADDGTAVVFTGAHPDFIREVHQLPSFQRSQLDH